MAGCNPWGEGQWSRGALAAYGEMRDEGVAAPTTLRGKSLATLGMTQPEERGSY